MAGLLGALLWAGASLPALGPARNLASELLRRLSIPGAVAVALLLALLVLLLLRGRLLVRLRNSDGFYARAFVEYLDRDRVGILLAFLVLYRAGESLLLAMLYPFMATLGLGRSDYGLLYGTFGVASSIAGGLLGGRIIARAGLRRAVWPLVLAQNVPNLLYGLLALWHGGGASVPVPAIGAFVVVESFGAGMGTAAFLVTIMRTCKKEHRAAHMAVATSIMNVSSAMAGVFSGFLAARLGWPLFFLATFLAACPAMGLLPFLPVLQEE
jgi:PAT family beta-lactamase induction signal transducer AmpG